MNDHIPNEDSKYSDDALPTQQIPEEKILDQTATDALRLISFYLPSRTQPVISKEPIITIGRRDPRQDITPIVDLTEERGAQLGVSRLHAEVSFQNGRYFIKDLGSSNGTWVNNTKLIAYQQQILNTGDQIRLGQLTILIHITIPIRDEANVTVSQLMNKLTDSDYSFRLITHSKVPLIQPQGGFAPILLETITRVLLNIEKLHTFFREVQSQEHEGFSVQRIRTEAMEGAILVDTKGGADILDFLIHRMDEFMSILAKGDATDEMSPKMLAALESAQNDGFETTAEIVAEYAVQEIVYRFLDDERMDFIKKTAPLFDEIINSTLEIVSADG